MIGAYAMLAGRLRAQLASPVLARIINIVWLGAAWLIVQALLVLTLEPVSAAIVAPMAGGMAANLGGFLVGLLLARPLLLWRWRGA